MGKRYGLRRGKLTVGAQRHLSGWPRGTRSHIVKGREEEGVNIVMISKDK